MLKLRDRAKLDGETGKVLQYWGSNEFSLPHGITVDTDAIWLTDVGTHMIYKFAKNGTKIAEMGKKMTPGYGEKQFCQPTDVLIDQSTGDFFVSDGYCNGRVARYSKNFEYLKEFGGTYGYKPEDMDIVHDMAAGPGRQIFVTDRENGRIKILNRDTFKLETEFHNRDIIGPNIFASVFSFTTSTLFLISSFSNVADKYPPSGFAFELDGTLRQKFQPQEKLDSPHDIAISKDEKCLFMAHLRPHRIFKVSHQFFNLGNF